MTKGVYISVEGSFSGSGHPATATLAVSLKFRLVTTPTQFRSGVELHLRRSVAGENPGRGSRSHGLFPRRRSGPYSPLYTKIRTPSRARTTSRRQKRPSALPFHGFNFVLVLQPYDAVSSCNDDNLGTQVFMVPCNLLEMLYAFVFSQEYRVSQYERYPVSFAAVMDIMSGASALFNVARRVQIRDGVVSNWVGNLGTVYANTPTTELYRT